MLPKVKGSHPWAVILCNASDQVAPKVPALSYFHDLVASSSANGLYTWWQQISSGNLDLQGSNVFGWYSLPNTLAQLSVMSRAQIVSAARTAATAAGADFSSYLHTLAIVTGYSNNGNTGSDVAYGITATNGQPA